ncbi:MAG: NAD-binding protein [Halobacteriales archaeon]|nr:NAD-binding protein [Halobacteriales archaeon]
MLSVRQRAKYYVASVAVIVVVSSVLYDYGMRRFEPGPYPPEDVEVSFLYSMQFVVETFTATGYGSHSPWSSPEMQTFVMLLDVTGVAIFFLALPAIFIPLFRKAISTTVPRSVGDDMKDHVVVSTYTPRAEALIEELEANDVEYVLVEPDRDDATELLEGGWEVVNADPETVEGLENANVAEARAVVADVSDQVDASIVLATREATEDVKVVSVVEDTELADYHELAGADVVLRPREQLGKSIASKVTTTVSAESDGVRIGDAFEIAEVPVLRDSELVGEKLSESRIRERSGVNVIGAWFGGDFRTPPPPDSVIDRGTVLLVAGTGEQLKKFRDETFSTVRRPRTGKTVIVGYGEGGQTVADKLDEAGVPHTVVDERDIEGVDVVGNATDADVLHEADIENARSLVLVLPDDTTTEFVTLVARGIDESVEIVARSQKSGAVGKTYRAGADYVLSIETVSGRSVASEILDEDVLSVGTDVEIIRTTASGLVGETLESARVRERTGCTVVAVEREGELVTDLPPDFRLEEGDEVVVAGTGKGTNDFAETFG